MIRKFYYNKGLDDIKKANYRNLSIDLADNPKSMEYLQSYNNLTVFEIATYVISGGLIIGGVTKNIKTMNADLDSSHDNDGIPALIVGGIIYSANAIGITILLKPSILKKVAKSYNGH